MKSLLAEGRARAGLAFAGLLIFTTLHAQLAFDFTERRATADPDARSLTLAFPFHNPGPDVVAITAVRTTCGCTTAALAKHVFGPGESGVIELTLRYADLTGRQRRAAYVDTSLPGADPIALMLDVTIPEHMTVIPRTLDWKHGAGPDTQRIVIAIAPGDTMRPTGVRCEPAGLFTAELRPVPDDPLLYEVAVTPLTNARPLQAILTVETNRPSGRANRFRTSLFAH